jgi:HK97 family phage major capsid protein
MDLNEIRSRIEELRESVVTLGAIPELSDEQRAEWDAATTEYDALTAREADMVQRAERAAAAAAVSFNVNTRIGSNPHTDDRDLSSIPAAEVRHMAVDAIERSDLFASDAHAEAATRLVSRSGATGAYAARLALATGSDSYVESWSRAMAGQMLSADDQRNLERAMSAGTGNTGGYYVPLMLDPTFVITGAGSTNPIRQIANVKQINTYVYNGATMAQVTAGLLGEGSAFSDNATTVSQVQIPTYKYGAYIPASYEAFEDIGNLAGDIGQLFADAKDIAEATAMLTSDGSSKPHGIVHAIGAVTASRVAPTTGGTFGAPDIYKVHTALSPRYRISGTSRAWLANVGTINSARQFATANNYHAFLTDLGGGQPPQLLGERLFEASAMSASLTTGQDILLFGDFSRYLVIDRIGMTSEMIPNVVDGSGLPTGQRAIICHWRFGAEAQDTAAFKLLRL